MEYNTKREKLKFNDYGRNIYKMIQHAINIPDRDARNAMARTIVNVMSQVNPMAKDNADYEHKLWDHLMILSNFELDVDSPYAITHEETVEFKPKTLRYKTGRIRYRHYGRNLEAIIREARKYPQGKEKEALTADIAHQMKKSYLTWNRNTVSDELIKDQFEELSEKELSLPEGFNFVSTQEYQRMTNSQVNGETMLGTPIQSARKPNGNKPQQSQQKKKKKKH